ncbi:MAG: RCC1 repeat-containing protein, partial [Chloroflexi bacterium]|nr:RCC1 repeat-containing protein [Chloroflexota bacterium]
MRSFACLRVRRTASNTLQNVRSCLAFLGLLLTFGLLYSSTSLQAASGDPPPARAQGLPQTAVPLSDIVQVAAGGQHTCALTTGGGVKCWGYNSSGQLGDGSTTDRSYPVDVVGLGSGVAAIATGGSHTCALTIGGGVKCWGDNYSGQLGDGTSGYLTSKSSPVDVVGLSAGVAGIAAGGRGTCALITGGGVKCWGENGYGQLGDGSTTNRSAPVDVTGLGSGATVVAVGGTHTCAITTTGEVKCWGWNFGGQLGDGSTQDRSSPADVSGLGSGVIVIATGDSHTCALTGAGGAKCWGSNNSGQLGDGTAGSDAKKTTPVDVVGLDAGMAAIAGG